jgi:hypothetical protein
VRIHVPDEHRAAAALRAGLEGEAPGLVFAPARDLQDWDAAEDELTEAFLLTQNAAADGAPVVYLVDTHAVLGRSAPLDAAVATGLLGGARALAFETRRAAGYATVVAADDTVEPAAIAQAIEVLLHTRAANGTVHALGAEHLGAMLP